MTDEEIIEMARQVAGMITIHANGEATYSFYEYQLKTFTNLVAQHEREACAKFLMQGVDLAGLAQDPMLTKYTAELLSGCAKYILARGQA